MNAVTSENPTGGSEASSKADAGPTEIIFGAPAEPIPVAKSADITDVEPKTEKSNSAAPKPAGTDEAGATPPANEEATDGSAAKSKSGIQDRIGELTKARRDAEREAAYWKNRATQENEAEAPAPLVAPKPEDFKTTEEYNDALIDYKVDLKIQQKEQKRSEAVQQETQQKAAKAASDNWTSKVDQARAQIQDYDSVMDKAELPVAPHVAQILFDHDIGPVLAHHFALNPDVLEKLNGMTLGKAAVEIVRISEEVGKKALVQAAPVTSAPAVNVSKAPPPPQPLGSGRSTTVPTADLPMEDYVAQRRKEGASWAR
jgi:hypothetical protein